MMKISSLYKWALATMVASLSACSNHTEELLSQDNEIRLTSEIIPSRVTALDYQSTQIVEGQKVGVTITGANGVHNNVAWTAGADGTLKNGGAAIYYKGTNEATVTAYHPYNSSWTSTDHIFTVSTDQSTNAGYLSSDLLWAKDISDKADEIVPLTFEHKLAKVSVTLVSDVAGADLSGITVYVCGTKTSTYFNPVDGSLSMNTSAIVGEIKAGVTTASAFTASAIVIPQTLAAGTQFIRIVKGDNIYSYSIGSQGKELKSGYSHNYTLTVKEKELKLISNNIANWEEDNLVDVISEQNFSWFNPNQYITYVGNEDCIESGRNTYYYSSYISCPVGTFSKIEFKYQIKESSYGNTFAYLCCRNRARENTSVISLSKNGLLFEDEDEDYLHDYLYSWNELGVSITDCMTLTTSFKDKSIKLNGVDLAYKMTHITSFKSSFLFSYYTSENDEGVWREQGEGVPEGSKLYYVKIWDENDNLIYLGAASKAMNPKTSKEEYCWRSYYRGEEHYEFAYYPEETTYSPYGGGIDN